MQVRGNQLGTGIRGEPAREVELIFEISCLASKHPLGRQPQRRSDSRTTILRRFCQVQCDTDWVYQRRWQPKERSIPGATTATRTAQAERHTVLIVGEPYRLTRPLRDSRLGSTSQTTAVTENTATDFAPTTRRSRQARSQWPRHWQRQGAAQTQQQGQGQRCPAPGLGPPATRIDTKYPDAEAGDHRCHSGFHRGERAPGCFTRTSWRFWIVTTFAGRQSPEFPSYKRSVDRKAAAQASGPTNRGENAATKAGERSPSISRRVGRVPSGTDQHRRTTGGADVEGTQRLRLSRSAVAVAANRSHRHSVQSWKRLSTCTEKCRYNGSRGRFCCSGCGGGLQNKAAGGPDSPRPAGTRGCFEQGKSSSRSPERWFTDTTAAPEGRRRGRSGAEPSIALSLCAFGDFDGVARARVMNLLLEQCVAREPDFVSPWKASLLGAVLRLDLYWDAYGVTPSFTDPRLLPLDEAASFGCDCYPTGNPRSGFISCIWDQPWEGWCRKWGMGRILGCCL